MLTVFSWSLKVNAYKEEKRACPFSSSPRRQKKTTKSFCRQRVGFEISRERQGLLLQSRKRAKKWQSSWKPIEATAESSFTNSLARGASFLGREAAKRETKSREVPRHIKIGWSTVLKVYCSGKEASRKTPGSGLLSIFPGQCPTFGLAQLFLSGAKMKTARCKLVMKLSRQQKGSNRAEPLKIVHLLSGFVFNFSCMNFSCCVAIVVPSLVCINIDSFQVGVIICYKLITGNTPPKIFFNCFLEMKIRASWGYVLNSKSATREPIWLNFGQLTVR